MLEAATTSSSLSFTNGVPIDFPRPFLRQPVPRWAAKHAVRFIALQLEGRSRDNGRNEICHRLEATFTISLSPKNLRIGNASGAKRSRLSNVVNSAAREAECQRVDQSQPAVRAADGFMKGLF